MNFHNAKVNFHFFHLNEGEKMEYKFKKEDNHIRIFRCFVPGSIVVIPETIDGCPVTEIGDYAFSAHGEAKDNEKAVCGEELTEIILPKTIRKIGRYAFYGCSNLERIQFYSNIEDIGAGAFTGCHKVRHMDVTIVEGKRSCLREMLLELREEQCVDYHSETGEARLVFPEYFEEAVENTPARILETHTHGSGMWYRNCFVQTEFQFGMYDKRFPWAKENERLDILLEMTFNRLLYPLWLGEDAKNQYQTFLREHLEEACRRSLEYEKMDEIAYLAKQVAKEKAELELLIQTAGKSENVEAFSFLMNEKHKRYPNVKKKMDKFDL